MRNKVIIVSLAAISLVSIGLFAIDRKFVQEYNIRAASMSKSVDENNISFYRNNQIILFKPNTKGKSKKPVPYTCTIKPDGDLSKPKFSKELSKLGFTGTVAYDSVNGKLYMSRYNNQEHDYALYESEGAKGKWSEPVQMKIDGTGTKRGTKSYMLTAGWNYRERGLTGFRNPSIAMGGNRIYFTAKLSRKGEGNVGRTDIYYIDKKPDGTWTRPTNCGKKINSYGNEDYAFCLGDTVLYYMSTGRGNVDIWKSYLINGEWIKGDVILDPINTHARDYNLIADANNIFLISNRDEKGHDDVWLFRHNPDTAIIPNPVPIPPDPEPMPIVDIRKDWNFVLFYFDFDKDVLTEEFLRQFNELVTEMRQFPGETFEIAGHCDQRGSDRYNQKLSERRANHVKNMLIQEGFPSYQLVAKGFGEKLPIIAAPKSEDEFQLNRRVEVRILSKDTSSVSSDSVRTSREEAEKQMPEDYKMSPDAPSLGKM